MRRKLRNSGKLSISDEPEGNSAFLEGWCPRREGAAVLLGQRNPSDFHRDTGGVLALMCRR